MCSSQTSVDFLRIKGQTGQLPEAPHSLRQQSPPARQSQDSAPPSAELPWGELNSVDTNANGDPETHSLHFRRVSAELEEERSNCQRLCAELAKEKESCQQTLHLLEQEKREREEERKKREDLQEQLGRAQSQSSEIQRYKEEKELLNTELLEMTRKLAVEQETAERLREEIVNSALRLSNLEEEREMREAERRRLEEWHREELDRIRQLLEEGEKEIDKLEKEDSGLKASKNRRNQERVSFGQEEEEDDEEGGLDQEDCSEDCLAGSVSTDILMARYLSSAHPAQSNSSLANQSLEDHILADNSANFRSLIGSNEPYCDFYSPCFIHHACQMHHSVHFKLRLVFLANQLC